MKEKLCILEAVDQPRAAVWTELEQYADVVTVRDGECAYQLLCEREFDLVLVNLMLNGLDGLELLRRIKNRNLCKLVVLTSDFPDFQYAQQGILYGAFDYLLRPLTKEVLLNLILRAKERIYHIDYTYQKECAALVKAVGSPCIMECYDEIVSHIAQELGEDIQLDVTIRRLYQSVIQQIFSDMPWIGRFLYLEDYDAIDWMRMTDRTIVRGVCRRKLDTLSQRIAELHPQTGNDKLAEILLYILEHVDDGYRQKDIAAAHYISNTALSDLFRNELGQSYRDYVTGIKMRRAEYLLQHSDMKIYEISALLGYKDVNYFSRMFRQRYGIALSQFRHQNQLDYQI
ncbi:MAG: DNA-binding response regulator [Clostridia bacterium]|nr:DNA-binding response regulator [Clostridia bacterium]